MMSLSLPYYYWCFVAILVSCLPLQSVGWPSFSLPRSLRNSPAPDPEIDMDAIHLITTKRYTGQEHKVTTPDGYNLRIHRIPCRRNETGTDACSDPRPVVFLMHGLLCSSTNWITNLANESFAFLLADAGFDVWMGNARGNTYGRTHRFLDPANRPFWQFSWDEIAKYDFPAMINYTLETSGQESLYYIGHSQGTMIAFAHLSENPEYGKKIKKFYALGPVNTIGHIIGPLKYIAYSTKSMKNFLNFFGEYEFMPNSFSTKVLSKIFCTGRIGSELCEDFLFIIAGFDSNQLNSTRLPVYFAHTPAGTSTQNMVHYGQMVESGRFEKFDYGSKEKNMAEYGQATPPEYDVGKMTVPVDLYCADKDRLADLQDIRTHLIPNLNAPYRVVILKDFNHLDFLWGMRAADEVYWPIIKDMTELEYTASGNASAFINVPY